jgi:hypothetical protein
LISNAPPLEAASWPRSRIGIENARLASLNPCLPFALGLDVEPDMARTLRKDVDREALSSPISETRQPIAIS